MTTAFAIVVVHDNDHPPVADVVHSLFDGAKRRKLTHDKLPGDVHIRAAEGARREERLQNTEARNPFSFFRTVTVGPGFAPDLRFFP